MTRKESLLPSKKALLKSAKIHNRQRKCIAIVFILGITILCWSFSTAVNDLHAKTWKITETIEEEQKEVVKPNWDPARRKKFALLELEAIQKKFKSLPEYYFKRENRTRFNNRGCAPYPSFTDLYFTNQHWQTLETGNGTIQILSAAYDDRSASGPVVRLVTMINRKNFTGPLACQLWFREQPKSVASNKVDVKLVWLNRHPPGRDGLYKTWVISCRIPDVMKELVPESVSLVNNQCDLATTNVKVFNERPVNGVKKRFLVCVRAVNFAYLDNAINFVEWVELLFILGADKIVIYVYQVSENFQKALNYYQQLGRVEVVSMTIPGQLMPYPGFVYDSEKHAPGWLLELAAFHHCFYKNMYKYDYISLVDTDEVITPVSTRTWSQMFEAIRDMLNPKQNYTYFQAVQTRFYMDWNLEERNVVDIPSYTPMLAHITRAEFLSLGNSPKGFYDTRTSLYMHNHWPLGCIMKCKTFVIPTNLTQLSHYRLKHHDKDTGPFIQDKIMWKYKEELIDLAAESLQKIGINFTDL